MSALEDDNRISIEYKHDVVEKFAKDLIDGRVYLRAINPYVKSPDAIANAYKAVGKMVDRYFDSSIHGEELKKLEEELFHYIVALRTSNLILPSKMNGTSDEEISRLEGRIDSTNNLLRDVMTILKEALKRLDKLSKK
jgi:hypothetical protein